MRLCDHLRRMFPSFLWPIASGFAQTGGQPKQSTDGRADEDDRGSFSSRDSANRFTHHPPRYEYTML